MERFHVETRSEVQGNKLTGYAALFGSIAKVPGHLEALAPTAFDESLKRDDVKAFYQHNPAMILGSTGSGSLRLSTDTKGLHFELELPDVSYAHDVRTLVESGVVNSMSFGFLPGKSEWSSYKGAQLRTHTSVERLLEISPVSIPAYQGTSVKLRSADEIEAINLSTQLIQVRHSLYLRSNQYGS